MKHLSSTEATHQWFAVGKKIDGEYFYLSEVQTPRGHGHMYDTHDGWAMFSHFTYFFDTEKEAREATSEGEVVRVRARFEFSRAPERIGGTTT